MAFGRKHNGLTGKVSLNTDDRAIAELNKETFFFSVIFYQIINCTLLRNISTPLYFQVQPLILSSSDGGPVKKMAASSGIYST